MRLGTQFNRLQKFCHRICYKIKWRIRGSDKQSTFPSTPTPLPSTKHFIPHTEPLARRFEGKLLLREEIPLSDEYFSQLLADRYFLSQPSIQKQRFHIICTRCHNRKSHLFATLLCARCKQEHAYCRNCIHMGRIMTCEKLYSWNGPSFEWFRYEKPCTWLGKLNHAQQNGANKIKEAVQEQKDLLVWAVTGAGKTEMLFPAISFALQQGQRICIASPRADVVRELLPRFKAAFRDVPIQALYSGSHDNDGTAQLIIATTHQLFRYDNAFDMLVVDEVDAFPYHQDESLKRAVNRAKKLNAATIYLTATPRQTELKRIASKKAELVFVPIRFHGHPLIVPQWIHVPKLKSKLNNSTIPEPFLSWLKARMNHQRQLLIFVPTIDMARKLEGPISEVLLHKQFIQSKRQVTSVHAEDEDRLEKVNAFRQRKLYTLITTTILERGVTFPSVDVIVFDAGHQVFDDAALVQITGRAGRSPKDPAGEVVFFHDGLTEAIVKANKEINQMNKRRQLLQRNEEDMK